KAASVSRAIQEYNKNSTDRQINNLIIHTGQHFDKNMSDVFFADLDIFQPDYNLQISDLAHGAMTGRMLEAIEGVLKEERPNLVLIYGDTNSTLAGALAAIKLKIPIAHIEAGLRSYNLKMPEEINRILADRISTYLFCPTETAVSNLAKEGITESVYNVGDVMYDAALYYGDKAKQKINLSSWGLKECQYVLCTIHRAENIDNNNRLATILEALREIAVKTTVLLPIHPRTRHRLQKFHKEHWLKGITVIDPLPYLEMIRLEMSAKMILTDSGGVQKEAFFHQVPCVTMRDETEWIETVELGWNKVVGTDKDLILDAFNNSNQPPIVSSLPYGEGRASELILKLITNQTS
ncbi:UDP-N-acetylglucosamine 2-epimerase (non-hydrolyzing), partial [bacterium]|nr:UDP-N-acetylglucosamine 2-epimerase (non-hydrolyzing) [bacterium]